MNERNNAVFRSWKVVGHSKKSFFSLNIDYLIIIDMDEELPAALQDHGYLAKPLHIQRLENALRLEPLLSYIDNYTSRSRFVIS